MIKKRRMNVGLDKKQIGFLDEISKNCKFSMGMKFSRSAIVRAFLTASKGLDIDLSGIKSEDELKKNIITAFKSKGGVK